MFQWTSETAITVANLMEMQKQLLLDSHPIGSLYWSEYSTEPSTLFGGTWERVKDKFILAAGDSYVAGSTGGSANAIIPYHNHTFTGTAESHLHQSGWTDTLAEAPSGKVGLPDNMQFQGRPAVSGFRSDHNGITSSTSITPKGTISYAGTSGNTKNANMPPYVTYYCWKRIA